MSHLSLIIIVSAPLSIACRWPAVLYSRPQIPDKSVVDILAVVTLLQSLETMTAQNFQAHPPEEDLSQFFSRVKGIRINPGHFQILSCWLCSGACGSWRTFPSKPKRS